MSERARALVVVNPGARHGTGRQRWQRVRRAVEERFEPEVMLLEGERSLDQSVERALREGIRAFVAAGGDGTVHALVNAIGRGRAGIAWSALSLGAVGLGSSNDFHKPCRSWCEGVPILLGPAAPRDVARALYLDEGGVVQQRLFLVSASLGVTACANAFFNRGDALLRFLKRWWVGGAIAYAAARSVALHRSIPLRL